MPGFAVVAYLWTTGMHTLTSSQPTALRLASPSALLLLGQVCNHPRIFRSPWPLEIQHFMFSERLFFLAALCFQNLLCDRQLGTSSDL